MRNWVWFVVAGVLAVAGVVGGLAYMAPRLAAADKETIRVIVPGSAVIELDQPGRYIIFHEYRSVVDGRLYESRSVDGLQVTLEAEGSGAPVPLIPPGMSSQYEFGNRAGRSWLAFDIDRPGRFRLKASLANGATEPRQVLAISRGLIAGMFGLILTTMGIAFIGLGLAALIVIVVLVTQPKKAVTRR